MGDWAQSVWANVLEVGSNSAMRSATVPFAFVLAIGLAGAANWRVVTVLLGAGANPKGSTIMSAADCTRQARQSNVGRRRTVLDRGAPTVEDFDRVLALLEHAEKQIKR